MISTAPLQRPTQPDSLETTLQALGLTAELAAVEPVARAWLDTPTLVPVPTAAARHRLSQGTIMYELLGAHAWPTPSSRTDDLAALAASHSYFHTAWAGYLAFVSCDAPTRSEIFEAEDLPPDLALAFHLSLTGLLADELPITRRALAQLPLPALVAGPARARLLQLAIAGLVRLIRQAPGDIAAVGTALEEVDCAYREALIAAVYQTDSPPDLARATALELLGLLHLLVILRYTVAAVQRGRVATPWVTWPQHDHAIRRAFAQHIFLLPLADLFCVGCRALLVTCTCVDDPAAEGPAAS